MTFNAFSRKATASARVSLLVIFAAAIVLRLAAGLYLGDTVPANTDETSYSALGARLAEGNGYTFDRGWYPFTPPNTPTAHWSFLYSAFVAAVYSITGPHPLAVRLVGAMIGGILLPWMMYRLSRRLFAADYLPEAADAGLADPPPGSAAAVIPILAALLAAVYLFFVLFAASLMTETFYITALLWSLERALALQQLLRSGHADARSSLRIGLGLGLALGVATLLRQSLLPWAPVMGLWLLWRGWRHGSTGAAFRALAVAAVLTIACILPFTIRNYVVYDNFLLLNSNAGYAMYSAQHPMHGTSFQEYAAAPLPTDLNLRELNEAEMDKELMRRGVNFVLAEPGRYALLSLSRVRDYFEFWPTPDTSPVNNIGRVISITLFLPFMLYGILLAIRSSRGSTTQALLHREDTAFMLLFMAFYTVLHILTWAMPRYRLPVDAAALPFAALALYAIAERFNLISPAPRPVDRPPAAS